MSLVFYFKESRKLNKLLFLRCHSAGWSWIYSSLSPFLYSYYLHFLVVSIYKWFTIISLAERWKKLLDSTRCLNACNQFKVPISYCGIMPIWRNKNVTIQGMKVAKESLQLRHCQSSFQQNLPIRQLNRPNLISPLLR